MSGALDLNSNFIILNACVRQAQGRCSAPCCLVFFGRRTRAPPGSWRPLSGDGHGPPGTSGRLGTTHCCSCSARRTWQEHEAATYPCHMAGACVRGSAWSAWQAVATLDLQITSLLHSEAPCWRTMGMQLMRHRSQVRRHTHTPAVTRVCLFMVARYGSALYTSRNVGCVCGSQLQAPSDLGPPGGPRDEAGLDGCHCAGGAALQQHGRH